MHVSLILLPAACVFVSSLKEKTQRSQSGHSNTGFKRPAKPDTSLEFVDLSDFENLEIWYIGLAELRDNEFPVHWFNINGENWICPVF